MKNIIPENKEGTQTNTERSIEFATEEESKQFFQIAKKRLLDVNHWHKIAGNATADFQLTDEEGKPVNRTAKEGDHFKIDIPGPGTITGEGSDWVRIESIQDDENYIGIRVRPASNPTNERKDIAHFFNDNSTSSFIIKKEGKKITAGVYGRNEKPNTKTETVVDKIRNATVATGAISGFSKLQWKSLVNGLIERN
jgi:hypothetical protein